MMPVTYDAHDIFVAHHHNDKVKTRNNVIRINLYVMIHYVSNNVTMCHK